MCRVSLRSVFVLHTCITLAVATAGSPLVAQENSDQADRLLVERVMEIWQGLTTGPNRPLTDAEAQALIVQLGDPQFAVREEAMERLSKLAFPPVEKLTIARRAGDLEIATRAAKILANLPTSRVPELALLEELFRTMAARKVRIEPGEFRPIIASCDREPLATAAQEAFVAALLPDDLPALKRMIAEEKNSRVRAAALNGWIVLSRDDITGELSKLLEDSDAMVRSTAALALMRKGQQVDWKNHLDKLDAEAKALVYREAEITFRRNHKKDRKEQKVHDEYLKLVGSYVEVLSGLKGVKRETNKPANNLHWIHLGMDTSKHPEVIAYKVKWFSGQWSCWLIPGYNDPIEDGRNLRAWACFNDHEHIVITTSRKDLQRIVLDVP